MPPKKAESADAVATASEPEVRGDPASGSEVAVESAGETSAAPASDGSDQEASVPGYVALRHLIRNGREYFPGDVVDMTPDPDSETNERLFAEHLVELKASGAIREA